MKRLCFLTTFLVVLIGCNQASLKPSESRENDVMLVRETDRARLKAWVDKDADRIASFWADDGSHFSPNMPALNGRAAVRTAFKEFLADPTVRVNAEATAVEVSKAGDMAYVKGSYTAQYTDPGSKKLVLGKGKYVTVYQKQIDGSWKIAVNSDSADAPAAAASGK